MSVVHSMIRTSLGLQDQILSKDVWTTRSTRQVILSVGTTMSESTLEERWVQEAPGSTVMTWVVSPRIVQPLYIGKTTAMQSLQGLLGLSVSGM